VEYPGDLLQDSADRLSDRVADLTHLDEQPFLPGKDQAPHDIDRDFFNRMVWNKLDDHKKFDRDVAGEFALGFLIFDKGHR
jgi:hypothetical protein